MKDSFTKKLLAKPRQKHNLAKIATDKTFGISKEKAEKHLEDTKENLFELQDRLYADNRYSVLIVFQAMDAAGKDGTIKHVMSGVNPQGCSVSSFKQPSPEDLEHDYMWRILKQLPERGKIGIFNRSHYEEVLITKVHPEILLKQRIPHINKVEDVDKHFWKQRYRQINDIERYLVENGTVIIKFFLHISKKEQEKRFLSRIDDKSKNWKFSISDLKEREFWNKYQNAYSEAITHTSTEHAPWYVIPADNKWFMRYAVSQVIIEHIDILKLDYPVVSQIMEEKLQLARKYLETGIKPSKKIIEKYKEKQ